MQEDELREAVVLVFANKQDLINAVPAAEVAQELDLMRLKDRPWQVLPCSAKTGDGLNGGFEWLMKYLKK